MPSPAKEQERSRPALFRLFAFLGFVLVVSGCSDQPSGVTSAAARGRGVYMAQCTACHAADPAQAGPIGPPLKGTSRELLDAKLLKGTYPPGYRPKRSTAIMPLQPAMAPEIPNLAAFLGSNSR